MVDCSGGLTIVSKTAYEVYVRIIHLVNSIASCRSYKIQEDAQNKQNYEDNRLLIDIQDKPSSNTVTKKHGMKSNKI